MITSLGRLRPPRLCPDFARYRAYTVGKVYGRSKVTFLSLFYRFADQTRLHERPSLRFENLRAVALWHPAYQGVKVQRAVSS
jgi:hypothetical protein